MRKPFKVAVCSCLLYPSVPQLPSRPRLSQECRDLLQRLLERDPLQRISFEEFFAHPFVDMEHMPSAESLRKAVSLTDAERSLVALL
uniref:non-specific serine/threonine protein kinase n=1 Tax=Chrysemys picta bellii TaxID=8478 RepID=A0A8C3F5L4_CHRPI